MTKDFNIKSIAIIGGGYSGLSTLADLLHTSSTGHSTIQLEQRPQDPAFDIVKLFEANSRIGGAWNHSSVTDPDLPNQEILETKDYWEPAEIIAEKKHPSSDLNGKEQPWLNSGVYDNLYTNISADFMTLSTLKKKEYPHREFSPYITHKEVLRILFDFVEKYNLSDHIFYNSTVRNIVKNGHGQYELTIVKKNPQTGEEEWQLETFDAIVIASGRFQYPYIPRIKNLPQYTAKYPNVVSHAKSFRRGTDFAGKKVVIVGSSVSSIGVLEYVKASAKEVFVSRRTFIGDVNPMMKQYNKAFSETGVNQVGEIIDIDIDNNILTFKSGETVSDIDHIILATGYHIYFPFLEDFKKVHGHGAEVEKANGDQRGLIQNLYHYVFTTGEPTIAHVGLPSSAFFVLGVEAQGAAIAGVWSNARKLPDIETQNQWYNERLEKASRYRILHQYEPQDMKDEIEYLHKHFFPFDRPNPADRVDVELFNEQRDKLEEIYGKFASGAIAEDYVSSTDTSGL